MASKYWDEFRSGLPIADKLHDKFAVTPDGVFVERRPSRGPDDFRVEPTPYRAVPSDEQRTHPITERKLMVGFLAYELLTGEPVRMYTRLRLIDPALGFVEGNFRLNYAGNRPRFPTGSVAELTAAIASQKQQTDDELARLNIENKKLRDGMAVMAARVARAEQFIDEMLRADAEVVSGNLARLDRLVKNWKGE